MDGLRQRADQHSSISVRRGIGAVRWIRRLHNNASFHRFSAASNGGLLTIEGFIRPVASSRLEYIICARTDSSLSSAWVLERVVGGGLGFVAWNDSGTLLGYASTSAAANGVWSHFAVVISGTSVRIYLNGVGTTASFSAVPSGGTMNIQIGRSPHPSEGSRSYTGHIDEVRITRGVARYTADFTPPTAPFPNS